LNSGAEVINKLIRSFGYEMRKAGHALSYLMKQPRTATSGWTLEFIGTQGIGKTTLNNAVASKLRNHWFIRSDLGQIGRLATASVELENLHRQLFFDKVQHLAGIQPDTWRCITVARQMSKVIAESLTILGNHFPRGFLLDESLFKNFPREVLELSDDDARPLWKKRGFVYLRARDPQSVVERYQGRVAERARQGLIQTAPEDAEVYARANADNVLFDAIVEKAHAFGCPALVVYAEDDHDENIRKILKFEHDLRTST
jgi:energy-coupling factor transporter ATP-binding protein EcfA2